MSTFLIAHAHTRITSPPCCMFHCDSAFSTYTAPHPISPVHVMSCHAPLMITKLAHTTMQTCKVHNMRCKCRQHLLQNNCTVRSDPSCVCLPASPPRQHYHTQPRQHQQSCVVHTQPYQLIGCRRPYVECTQYCVALHPTPCITA